MFVGKAYAQLQSLPSWAVVEFVNKKGGNYGTVAAESVASELAKTGKYDVVPQETIKRSLETLSLQSPVTDKTSILRLAQDLRVQSIVQGEVVDFRVENVGGGKQATVAVKVVVIDAASGLGVNGAALAAKSTVRAGEVSNETLVAEALGVAANQAVGEIQANTLPVATVLNTQQDNTALINQGERSGFKRGQQVIVIRNREQVAVASVSDVEPDQAYIKANRVFKGIRPGDKVRVVFEPRDIIKLTPSGDVDIRRERGRGNNAGLISIVLVLGLGLLLFSNGNSSSQSATETVTTEATLYPDNSGQPAVKISWRPNIFAKGNSTRFRWQVWRDDVIDSPVLTSPGGTTFAYDTQIARTVTYSDFGGRIGGTTCDFQDPGDTESAAPVNGPTPGRAHLYRVELVYRLSSLDLPGGTSTGSGSTGSNTTGSNTTGSNTTGSNTTGTNTTGSNGTNTGSSNGAVDCYFVTSQTQARGVATPLFRSDLQSPANGESYPAPQPGYPEYDQITFSFNSVVQADPIAIEYVVEVSSSPSFSKGTTRRVGTTISSETGPVSITVSNNFMTATNATIWWRVGAKNTADKPGPVGGYVFSTARNFKRPIAPPPPPSN